MTNERKTFFPPEDIIDEFKNFVKIYDESNFDVVTIVSEGEPVLYFPINVIIDGIKKITSKKVVLITNGSLFYDKDVRREVKNCDIIMPTLDAWDEKSFKVINRPFGTISYEMMYNGLLKLKDEFEGQIWLEVMLIKGINDSIESIKKLKEKIEKLQPERVYVNVPIRPPAEDWVKIPDEENLNYAQKELNAYVIEKHANGKFLTINDDYTAVVDILKRHPLRINDIENNFNNSKKIIAKLFKDPGIIKQVYNGTIYFIFKNRR